MLPYEKLLDTCSKPCIQCLINSNVWEKYFNGEMSFNEVFKWLEKQCDECVYFSGDGCTYEEEE